jgi:hypothetical protein
MSRSVRTRGRFLVSLSLLGARQSTVFLYSTCTVLVLQSLLVQLECAQIPERLFQVIAMYVYLPSYTLLASLCSSRSTWRGGGGMSRACSKRRSFCPGAAVAAVSVQPTWRNSQAGMHCEFEGAQYDPIAQPPAPQQRQYAKDPQHGVRLTRDAGGWVRGQRERCLFTSTRCGDGRRAIHLYDPATNIVNNSFQRLPTDLLGTARIVQRWANSRIQPSSCTARTRPIRARGIISCQEREETQIRTQMK